MGSSQSEIQARVDAVRFWYHKIPLGFGIVTPGVNDPSQTLQHLDLPEDCRGMRVLDLGARDGYFSFEMERRGAAVVAVDYAPADRTGFATAADVLGSKVEYRQANIYDLDPARHGTYDIVLFLGLLYHLPDPLRAIEIVRSLCTGRLCLETHAIDNGLLMKDGTTKPLAELSPLLSDVPLMQFYPGKTLSGDPTNYWGPNLSCLVGMLEECRFRVLSHVLTADRAIVNAQVAEDPERDYLLKLARGLRPTA
jgi:tRNA (mo5U34)-methyltransferase